MSYFYRYKSFCLVDIFESIQKMRDFGHFLVNFSRFDDVFRRTGWSVRSVLPMFNVSNPGYVVYSIYGKIPIIVHEQ